MKSVVLNWRVSLTKEQDLWIWMLLKIEPSMHRHESLFHFSTTLKKKEFAIFLKQSLLAPLSLKSPHKMEDTDGTHSFALSFSDLGEEYHFTSNQKASISSSLKMPAWYMRSTVLDLRNQDDSPHGHLKEDRPLQPVGPETQLNHYSTCRWPPLSWRSK